jgi:hypothetical protein
MQEIGNKVKLHYSEGAFSYTLHVENVETRGGKKFVGRVKHVFGKGQGEVTGGTMLDLIGGEIKFTDEDII